MKSLDTVFQLISQLNDFYCGDKTQKTPDSVYVYVTHNGERAYPVEHILNSPIGIVISSPIPIPPDLTAELEELRKENHSLKTKNGVLESKLKKLKE